jgi:diaminohydroxyphosphoribosylaminopyrimidine deaminase/5-amino-6-(5-phosphoribosylamino)uracil reductase
MFGEGIRGLLVEGGATTIAAFFREGLVDAVELFVAPKLLGDGPAWIGGLALPSLDLAPKLEITRVRKLGDDLQISARPA